MVNQQPQIIKQNNNAESVVYVNQTRSNNPQSNFYGQQSRNYVVNQSGVFPMKQSAMQQSAMQQSAMQQSNFVGQQMAIGQQSGFPNHQNGIISEKQSQI
jgi:hypothetical protein